jgi:succinate dehydrogenase/fumarate reductase-like Fe-S protein
VSASRFQALSYLAYRALLAHPFKRLRQEGSGLERFLESYAGADLSPTPEEDRAVAEAASACVGCGLCEARCPPPAGRPTLTCLGLPALFRLHGRSSELLAHARRTLEECAACAACDDTCPTGVPISRVVKYMAARARAETRAAG